MIVTGKRALLPLAQALAASALLLAGCAGRLQPITRTELDMATVCSITVWQRNDSAVDAAFERIRDIDRKMSVQRDDSELSAINRAAGGPAVKVSPDTFEVIKEGLSFSKLSDGAFDITVGPLVNLWGIGTDHARVPSAEEIAKVLPLVNWRNVELDETRVTVRLKVAGMALDLGAIAKGYAADEAARLLASAGVKAALIDLGGNVYTLGSKPDQTPWRIGLQDPDPRARRGTRVAVLTYPGTKTVVTSGVYERFFEQNGVRYHHILDTKTGAPVRNGLSAVTIITDVSMIADAYSTLVFILGLERGRQLVEQSGGAIQAVFITDGGAIFATEGAKKELSVSDPRYTLKGW